MSLNIYNPTTQQLTEVAGLDVKDSLEKVATLPTPTADYLNQVYILVGTQEGYHVGSIYQCRYINSAYTWVEITGSVVGKADKAPNATNNHLAKLTADGNLADSGIAVGDLGTAINKNWTDLVRPNSHDLVESNAVYSAIANAISSIYTPHGDITCAELVPALLIEENIGNVYTVTDSGTTTAYFMQGAGKTINVGDSVSIIKAGATEILFNLMGNVLDLTDYQKKNLTTPLVIGGTTQTTVEGALGGLNTTKAEQAEVNDIVNVLGAKNLLPNGIYGTVTHDGITYTRNMDGSLEASGNNSAANPISISVIDAVWGSNTNGKHLPIDEYFDRNKPYIVSVSKTDINVRIRVSFYDSNDALISGASIDTRTEEDFTIPNNAVYFVVRLTVSANTTITTGTIYPMIRLASDPDNTYVPYAMTNQQITPYVQAISNPNLFDNPWFTVNQREITNDWATQFSLGVDRWRKSSTSINTIQVTANGIKEVNNKDFSFYQVLDSNAVNFEHIKQLYGKNLTFSILFSDGQIETGTVFLPSTDYRPSTTITHQFISNSSRLGYAQIESFTASTNVAIRVLAGNYTVRAVKLEVGTVSTLKYDVAPNYIEELQKCKAFFERNSWFGWTPLECTTAGQLRIGLDYKFDVAKIRVPTFIFKTDNNNGLLYDLTSNTTIPSSEIVISNSGSYNKRMIELNFAHSSIVVGHKYRVSIGDNVFDASAEI